MYEPEEITGYTRTLRGWTRRADDAEALGQLVELQRQLDELVADAARRLHGDGYSWTELAAGVSSITGRRMSRQAARQRWSAEHAAPAVASFHSAVDSLAAGAAGVDLAAVCGADQ